MTARNEAGRLVGLARVLSDDLSIVYVEDVLVDPAHRRNGNGRVSAVWTAARRVPPSRPRSRAPSLLADRGRLAPPVRRRASSTLRPGD
ncbi:hypothetical protein [Ilumatobacter nonamiensis]|uniref:hypothetical protein n=1 Tax=Ilumatobacter nonamiensis TaxID=467093 RepID=UPI00357142B6